MRDIVKNIEIELDGETKTFRLTKMNAFDGAYLMKFVTEKAMPLLQEAIDFTSGQTNDAINLKMIADLLPKLLASLSAEELKNMMILCLQTVDVPLPAGYQKVVDKRGNFGIEDLENDTATCLRLVYEVIVYNTSGFFAGSGLSSLLTGRIGARQEQ